MRELEPHLRILTIEPTQLCNQRCLFCNNWRLIRQNDFMRSYYELEADIYEGVINDAVKMGVKHINLGGGEPFAYSEVLQIVGFVKSRDIECSLVTNGTLMKQSDCHSLVDMAVNAIRFSIDASSAEVYDWLRGSPGSFDKAVAAVNMVVEYGNKKGFLPLLSINSTITRFSIDEIPKLARLAARMGVPAINYGFVIQISHEAIYETERKLDFDENVVSRQFAFEERSLLLERSDIPKAIGLLKKAQKEAESLGIKNNIPLMIRYLNFPDIIVRGNYLSTRFEGGDFSCTYPYMRTLINPQGIVSPCASLRINLGNIQESSLSGIWLGDKYNQFRKTLKEQKYFPICLSCCNLNRREDQ